MNKTPTEPWGNRTLTLRGDKIRTLRQTAGLSQMALALNSMGGPHHLSESTIKRAEAGKEIYLETASRLAHLLGVHVKELLADGSTLGPTGVAIGVMPFAASRTDVFAKTVAHGLFQDLTTRLSQCWFPVIAMRTMHTVATDASPEQLFAELGLTYLLRGSVQVTDTRYRATIQLVKADGSVELAVQRDFSMGDELDVQDGLMAGLVANLSVGIVNAEYSRLHDAGKVDLDAWSASVLGVHLFNKNTAEDNRSARSLLQEATTRDPSLVAPAYFLTMSYQRDLVNAWTEPQLALVAYGNALMRFRELHGSHPLADLLLAYAATYDGNPGLALQFARRTVERAPNCDQAYCLLGQLYAMLGKHEEATETLEVALRLCPRDGDGSILLATALAHFVAERYDQARNIAELAVAVKSCAAPGLALLTFAASSALSGDLAAAHAVAGDPRLSGRNLDSLRLMVRSTLPEITARFMHGLALANIRPPQA